MTDPTKLAEAVELTDLTHEMQVVQKLRLAALRTTWEQDGSATFEVKHPDRTLLEEAATVILALTASTEEIARLKGERDEALDRVDELEKDAEIVSTEFEKDCWIAVRSLLQKVGHTDFAEGVTAQDACEIIWEAIRDRDAAQARSQTTIASMRAALAPFAAICVGRESLPDDAEIEVLRTQSSLEFSAGPNVSRARLFMREFRAARDATSTAEDTDPCPDCGSNLHGVK